MLNALFFKQIYRYPTLILLTLSLYSCENKEKTNDQSDYAHTNDLIEETSPYLLQHAHNPVDWKAWNDTSLEKAKKEEKLMVISVGYSACHWCHVMEDESFKNDSVAKLMNEKFVSIKVDMEERPDINQIYIDAVELMTGKSGWPLNVIALPDGRPVFGGTYFTKEQWMKALGDISKLYEEDPEKLVSYASKLEKGIQSRGLVELNTEDSSLTKQMLAEHVSFWNSYLDMENGGQMTDTKFPLPNNLYFQLRYAYQNEDSKVDDYVNTTLTKMALGGLYDQLAGGFSRYSTDAKWHIPHFEKMLYDNAQLVSLYSNAYLATKNELYKKVVTESLKFVQTELTAENGAFFSSLDADSQTTEGELEEGAYYRWTREELQNLLKDDFELFRDYYNVNDFGTWENNTYILIRNTSQSEFAKTHHLEPHVLDGKISEWKKMLLDARNKRQKPRLDDKVLTSWNAMMIRGYVDAFRAFNNQSYLDAALKNADFIVNNQIQQDGGLYHNYKDGKSTINGYLEDYALIIAAFIDLYQVTFDANWLEKAKQLTDYTTAHFLDGESQMYYFTSDLNPDLISRRIEIQDGVNPASNSVMAHNLFELGHFYANSSYSKRAKQMLKNILPRIEEAPSQYANWLNLALSYTNPYYEVAISGKDALKTSSEFHNSYIPNILMVGAMEESRIPLLENRFNDDETYIYVCVDGTCKLPVTEPINALQLIKK